MQGAGDDVLRDLGGVVLNVPSTGVLAGHVGLRKGSLWSVKGDSPFGIGRRGWGRGWGSRVADGVLFGREKRATSGFGLMETSCVGLRREYFLLFLISRNV